MKQIDHTKIIADYKAAYEAARGKEYPGRVRYENGWFLLSGGGIFAQDYRYRAAAIADMSARLLKEAASK
jgi:hypothetical protein